MIPHSLHIPRRNTPRVLAQSAVEIVVTNVTTDTIAKSITIPGGLLGPDGGLIIETDWVCTNNANAKSVKVWANGLSANEFLGQSLASQAAYRQSLFVVNKGATNSQVTTNWGGFTTSTADYHLNRAVDTSVNWTIDLLASPTVATDSITLKYYSIILVKP